MNDRVLVSIVTPTLNQASFLARTLASVRAQTYPWIEHIVIDGGSRDGTLEVLREAAAASSLQWASEPDAGMYDAVNKGLRRSKGDVLGYLNSDDAYLPWAVEVVMQAFAARPDVELVYGDGMKIEQETGVQRLRLFPPFDRVSLANYESLMQPAVFWRRSLFERLGGFDSSLHYVADLDFWLRASAAGATIAHVDEVIAVERIHEGRLSDTRKSAMAAEGRDMRARHAGSQGGAEGRDRAKARDMRYQVQLFRSFVIASMLRRVPVRIPGPWPRFLREGGTIVKWRRALKGSQPHQGKFLRNAVISTMAADVLGVARPQALREQRNLDGSRDALVASGSGAAMLARRLPRIAARTRGGRVVIVAGQGEPTADSSPTVELAAVAQDSGLSVAAPEPRMATDEFLAAFDGLIVAVYVAAFDSPSTPLAWARALSARLAVGGVIVFDGTRPTRDSWTGSGAAAVPALLRDGFAVAGRTQTAVLVRRGRRRPLPIRMARRTIRRVGRAVRPVRRVVSHVAAVVSGRGTSV